MKITPLGNVVLVRLEPDEPSGNIILVRKQTATSRATVVAKGPDVKDLSVGDTVLVSSVAGMAVGEEVLIRESSVLATL